MTWSLECVCSIFKPSFQWHFNAASILKTTDFGEVSFCISIISRASHGDSDGKESVCSVGDPDLIPGWGRSPGEGNDYALQYSCLENSMDRGAW